MTKKKPVGWRGESHRHAQAARGIKTARTPAERKELRKQTQEYLARLEPTELEMREEGFEVKLIPTKFILDFTNMTSAFTPNTTYWGGYVTVNGVKVDVPESDRNIPGLDSIIGEEIEKQLGRELTDDELGYGLGLEGGLFGVVGGARHGPDEVHLPAVVEWRPKKDVAEEKEVRAAKHVRAQLEAGKRYISQLPTPLKKEYAQKYLDYIMAKGKQGMPRVPGGISDKQAREIRRKIFPD